MALSQIQCLDNNNVNWRSSESKPEFFYSEEQRLALEALVSTGQDSFYEVIKKENIRDFLSELELSRITGTVEPFDPDSGHHSKISVEKSEKEEDDTSEDNVGHSLEYWPDKSDCSIPDLDLGWPDTVAYRGVTRATVYMQPPLDGQPHIKEVVRKMITQAQKVIAIVMDLFTDLDILKDILEAGFKKKVSVYIILNEHNVKYFLQMCERAQMHKGHLKNLRVRTVGGSEFYTRYSTKFKGTLGQKFMFVDGDKAVCGSYSFTWSAARIDRNLVTVLTGQVVESFDHQFQELYLLSKGVSLKDISIDDEPEPEPVAQPVVIPTGPSEAIARKLINPKYALVKVKSSSDLGAASAGSKPENNAPNGMKIKKAKVILEQPFNEFQIHPALQGMERANMFDYLPTWVEPDPEPGSDILGYINIVDPKNRNAQLSQMNRIKICDTSHATTQLLLQNMAQDAKQEKKQSSENGQVESSSHVNKEEKNCENPTPVHNKSKITTSRQASKEDRSSSQSCKKESSHNEDSMNEHHIAEKTESTKAPPRCSENIAASAGSQDCVTNSNKPVAASGPPVPKPRTVPVTDFISMKNTLNENCNKETTSKDENTVPSVNGVDAEGREVEDIDELLINSETAGSNQDEEDIDGFEPGRPEYSTSGSSSRPESVASSLSEEYYPTKPLQRRGSDNIPNGEYFPVQRKMSDGHISRGSFVSPFNISHSMMENGQSRNHTLEEEIKRALNKNHQMQGNNQMYSIDPTQGKMNHHFGSGGPLAGYERFQRQDRYPGNGRTRNEGADMQQGMHQAHRKTEGSMGRPSYWNIKDFSGYASPHTPSPAPSDNTTSPFGIPYSKLSQSKHLKTKLGASSMDSKRRSHGPPGHKDL
ncbi:protein FAM83G [Bombina bombina]|uniref:protein FAM83G n=1 Tax=Bombina bombina TaxID=8345 RepID=UPI00235ADA22|nr:protein FAM83G [Bombina bombina]